MTRSKTDTNTNKNISKTRADVVGHRHCGNDEEDERLDETMMEQAKDNQSNDVEVESAATNKNISLEVEDNENDGGNNISGFATFHASNSDSRCDCSRTLVLLCY